MKRETKRYGALILGVIATIVTLITVFQTVTTVDAGEIIVKQNVIDGDLQVWDEPGVEIRLFGNTESYPKSDQFWFEAADQTREDEEAAGAAVDRCFRVRFNDQGTAKLCGSVSWEMPTDPEAVKKLHVMFRSEEGIESRLIKPALDKAIYNSGPLMSSRESAGDRRSELIAAIRDQTTLGVYRVEAEEVEVEDFMAEAIDVIEMIDQPKLCPDPAPEGSDCNAGEPVLDGDGKPIMEPKPTTVKRQPKKKVKLVTPKLTADGKIEIAEKSTVTEYGIRLFNFTINRIAYDDRVMRQIKAQQEATMAIQTARALAQKAQQDALTATAKGQAEIAQTKAIEEVKKQAATTQAETRLEVSRQDLETARQAAQAVKVTADADAYAKKQSIVADGALDRKLAAWVKAQEAWAAAASKQRLVPEVQMGNSSGGEGGIRTLMEIMAAKSARDLALDMSVKK